MRRVKELRSARNLRRGCVFGAVEWSDIVLYIQFLLDFRPLPSSVTQQIPIARKSIRSLFHIPLLAADGYRII